MKSMCEFYKQLVKQSVVEELNRVIYKLLHTIGNINIYIYVTKRDQQKKVNFSFFFGYSSGKLIAYYITDK